MSYSYTYVQELNKQGKNKHVAFGYTHIRTPSKYPHVYVCAYYVHTRSTSAIFFPFFLLVMFQRSRKRDYLHMYKIFVWYVRHYNIDALEKNGHSPTNAIDESAFFLFCFSYIWSFFCIQFLERIRLPSLTKLHIDVKIDN